MSQQIMMLTGISGVGKTTFLTSLSDYVSFQCLTGSTLIAAAREQQDRDTLRHSDIAENQALLLEGFRIKLDRNASIVILDGHVSIATSSGLEDIPAPVFRDLRVSSMIHLEAEPEHIRRNRLSDQSRDRPVLTSAKLKEHQDHSRTHAKGIAAELRIPFHIAKHGRIAELANVLLNKSTQRQG